MKRFCDLTYERPDMEVFFKHVDHISRAVPKAGDYAKAKELYLKLCGERDHLDTMNTVAEIRNTINTADAFMRREMEFFSEALPKAELKMKAANEQILAPRCFGF